MSQVTDKVLNASVAAEKGCVKQKRPERILQFGEGNFLRCFIDWQVDILNEKKGLNAGVVVVRPIDTDFPPLLDTQDGLYTSIIRGYDEQGELKNEKRLISCITREIPVYKEYDKFLALAENPDLRFIVSNTTEAGIAYNPEDRYDDRPQSAYPAKLTRFLHERFKKFGGSSDSGFILIPCELIDYNGDALKEIVLKYADLWNLEEEFVSWIEKDNTFCSTLVDRIVTGYPRDEVEELTKELGYKDNFITTGEYFHLFVIQGPDFVGEELHLKGSGLNIKLVEDLKPYKQRKVGILNGCHTALVPVAYLCGIELVKDAVENPDLAAFIQKLLDNEIIPNLGMPVDYLKDYAETVLNRFRNPFINHQLLSISLNSMTKFKTRLLPQFMEYYKSNSSVPPLMSLSLAALICFYRGTLDGKEYPVNDDKPFLDLYKELWQKDPESLEDAMDIAGRILSLDDHWGVSLKSLDGLHQKVGEDILKIITNGMTKTLEEYL